MLGTKVPKLFLESQKRRGRVRQKIFEEIMPKNFPKLTHSRCANTATNNKYEEKYTRSLIVKGMKTKDKEKILQVARRKKVHMTLQ